MWRRFESFYPDQKENIMENNNKKEKVAAVMKLLSTKKGLEALLEFAKSDDNAVEAFELTLDSLQKNKN